jgi:hypothetical protein
VPPALHKDFPRVASNAADKPIEVTGRVLDPKGKPFAGAKLYVGHAVHRQVADQQARQLAYPLRALSGADGAFHFIFTKSELDTSLLDDSRPAVIAVADGCGPGWAEVGDAHPVAPLHLRLVQDLPVEGRILDSHGQPVAGATVAIVDVFSDAAEGVGQFLLGNSYAWSPQTWRGSLPGPKSKIATDADGRFRMTGLGRDRIVALLIEGPALPPAFVQVATRPMAMMPPGTWIRGAAFEWVAPASRPIQGVVRDQATGKGVAGVTVSIQQALAKAVTDTNGRFEIRGCPKVPSYLVMAEPGRDQPYFAASAQLADGPGVEPLDVNLELVSGIPLRGRLTDSNERVAPKAAVLEYHPLFPNRHSTRLSNWYGQAASTTLMQPDGSFQLVVLPGPGIICAVASPRNAYAVAHLDAKELARLFKDGQNHGASPFPYTAVGARGSGVLRVTKYNAVALIHPDEGMKSLALDLTVLPARTVRGTVIGIDGQPLVGVHAIGLGATPCDETLDGASFTVMGLNPRCPREVIFHDRARNLGKALTIRGDEVGPLTVRLDPCGWLSGRIVDKSGQPIPQTTVSAIQDCLVAGITDTDADGRFRLSLVSGRKYSLSVSSLRPLRGGSQNLEVMPGHGHDMGDMPWGD